MKCFSLMLGVRHTGTRGPRFKAAADRRIRDITQRHFPDGFTILKARGGWFDPSAHRFVAAEAKRRIHDFEHHVRLLGSFASLRMTGWKVWSSSGPTTATDEFKLLKQEELLAVELGPARRFRIGR